jgi:hypothetical protein
VAEGNEEEAIALSMVSNLICPLTAFIAWDESEKVVVASHHLVQPSMSLDQVAYKRGVFSAGGTLAKRCLGAAFQYSYCDHDADETERLRSLPETPRADALELKRELSDLCHRLGVSDWEQLVKAIFDWIARADSKEQPQRIELISRFLEKIEQKSADEIHRLLKAFVDGLSAN